MRTTCKVPCPRRPCPHTGLEPGPLDLESGALTMRPQCLHKIKIKNKTIEELNLHGPDEYGRGGISKACKITTESPVQ